MSTITVKELAAPTGFDLKIAAGETLDLKSQGSVIMPAGHILQIVNFRSTAANTSTTSTGFQDAGIAVTITPSSANSKIWVMASVNGLHKDGANTSAGTRLVRGSTELSQIDAISLHDDSTSPTGACTSMNYLDSPNTTSATEYKIQFRSCTGGTVYVNTRYSSSHTTHSTITLMEVAG